MFFNWHQSTPAGNDGKFEPGTSKQSGAMKEMLEGLGDGGQGIFLLHHALMAFPGWPLWRDLSGMRQRGEIPYALDQTVHIDVADTGHPITATLEPWDIVDETYNIEDADEDSRILLTTNHPQSMKTIAWTRTFGKARVFCYQNGDDNQAYSNPGFRTVVGRGVQWLGGETDNHKSSIEEANHEAERQGRSYQRGSQGPGRGDGHAVCQGRGQSGHRRRAGSGRASDRDTNN